MALVRLPVELIQDIALNLTDDHDLCQLGLVCRKLNEAVLHFRTGVWRKRFALCFDLPRGMKAIDLKTAYQLRRERLRKNPSFRLGQKPSEKQVMKVIRDLVVESFINGRRDSFDKLISNNLTCLEFFIKKSDILVNVFAWPTCEVNTHSLLQVIQLIFTPWSLKFPNDYPIWAFPLSQKAVYSHPNRAPLFYNQMTKVNLELLLHIANFFKWHLTSEGEVTLFNQYQELDNNERPRIWQHKLEQHTTRIGKTWLGCHAYLDAREMRAIRKGKTGEDVFTDVVEYEDGFKTLDLDFTVTNCEPWPGLFEEHLHGVPSASLLISLDETLAFEKRQAPTALLISPPYTPGSLITPVSLLSAPSITPLSYPSLPANSQPFKPAIREAKAASDYLQFSGTGVDREPFHCAGILHAIPPQEDIPGWQRITMMQRDSDATAPGVGMAIDSLTNDCWAYEGVVLPGGMMMLGRWWSPLEEGPERLSTGPFIFWNVPDENGIVGPAEK